MYNPLKYGSLLLTTLVMQWLTTVYTYNQIEWGEKPLKDFLLDNIGFEPAFLDIVNVMLLISLIILLAHAYVDKTRIFIKKGIICYFIFACIRSLCVCITILPVPKNDHWCFENRNMNFWEITASGLQGNSCGDYVLSGHASLFTYSLIPLLKERYAISIPALCYYIIGCVLIVVSNIHYTSDVVLGMYISCSIWYLYDYILLRNGEIKN
jgi:hypothetical protein